MTWDTLRAIGDVVWFLLLVFIIVGTVGTIYQTARKVDQIAQDVDRIKRGQRLSDAVEREIIDAEMKGPTDA